MKKFMLTLIVILPIAIVFVVAFSAAAIIREILYYNITGVRIDWGSVQTNNTSPVIKLKRGESFDFFQEGFITVYPAKAKLEDIVFKIYEESINPNVQDIIDIEGGVIKAKTNLTNQYVDGVSIIMSNKDNTDIKYETTGKSVGKITIRIEFTTGDPIDIVKYDQDGLINSVSHTAWSDALSVDDEGVLTIDKEQVPDDSDMRPTPGLATYALDRLDDSYVYGEDVQDGDTDDDKSATKDFPNVRDSDDKIVSSDRLEWSVFSGESAYVISNKQFVINNLDGSTVFKVVVDGHEKYTYYYTVDITGTEITSRGFNKKSSKAVGNSIDITTIDDEIDPFGFGNFIALQMSSAVVIAPSSYRKPEYITITSSDTSVLDVQDVETKKFCLIVNDVGEATVSFTLTVDVLDVDNTVTVEFVIRVV